MIRTILVPLDGLPLAKPALSPACRISRKTGLAMGTGCRTAAVQAARQPTRTGRPVASARGDVYTPPRPCTSRRTAHSHRPAVKRA